MGEGACLLKRHGISIWGEEEVLELDQGGGYTAL